MYTIDLPLFSVLPFEEWRKVRQHISGYDFEHRELARQKLKEVQDFLIERKFGKQNSKRITAKYIRLEDRRLCYTSYIVFSFDTKEEEIMFRMKYL